jgi:hypothetical protein
MIVPTSLVPLARSLGAGLSPAGMGMFTTPLSPTGEEPATHYVSSGAIEPQFTQAISSPENLFALCQEAQFPVTLDQCTALINNSVVSTDNPFIIFEQMGLKIIMGSVN